MARTRAGLNNPAHWDYLNNRRFAAQKEIQPRKNTSFKIEFALLQFKAVNVKNDRQIVRRITVR